MTEAALKVDELKDQAEPFLTEKAKKALAVKARDLLRIVDGVTTHQCLYFGKKVNQDSVEEGIKTIAEKINALADKDLIHSALSHFIKFDLSPESSGYDKPLQTVVLCYVLVPTATYNEIMADKKSNQVFSDGDVP